jgi:hypothetical protein
VRGISPVLVDFNFEDVRLSAFGLGASHGSESSIDLSLVAAEFSPRMARMLTDANQF